MGPTLPYTKKEEEALLDADLQVLLDGLNEIDDARLDLLATSIMKIRKARSPHLAPYYPELPSGPSPACIAPVSEAIMTTTSNLGCTITNTPVSSATADEMQVVD